MKNAVERCIIHLQKTVPKIFFLSGVVRSDIWWKNVPQKWDYGMIMQFLAVFRFFMTHYSKNSLYPTNLFLGYVRQPLGLPDSVCRMCSIRWILQINCINFPNFPIFSNFCNFQLSIIPKIGSIPRVSLLNLLGNSTGYQLFVKVGLELGEASRKIE